MTKKTFLGAMAVVTAVALTGTALVASNMGFKLNYSLNQSGGGADTGTTTLALPDNRQTGLNNALDLMNDIGFANVASVQKYLKATDSLQVYTGRKNVGGPNAFSLAAGEGYRVRMTTSVNYIVVGSDDPALSYNLAQSAGGADTGTTFFAFNYHQTATDALALMNDIGFANVASVQKYLKATDSLQVYTGRKNVGGPNAFALTPGEAYRVRMTTTVNYIPSHY